MRPHSKNGDGGFIDTSAAHVNIADTAKITTKANTGKTGTWIIDPADFTIAASGGDTTGAALSASLSNTGITIFSTSGASGINGDININDVVNWSANTLTLNALRNININANLIGSGTAKLALLYGQASATGGANDNYFINGAKVNLPVGLSFFTQKGSNIANLKTYNVITSLGFAGDQGIGTVTLQGMAHPLNQTRNFVLGTDIDASATSRWNGGAGFVPIGSGATAWLIGSWRNPLVLIDTINICLINKDYQEGNLQKIRNVN